MRMWKRAAKAALVCGVAAGTVFMGAAWASTSDPVPPVSSARITIDGHSIAEFDRCMIASAVAEVGATPRVREVRCERAVTRNIEMSAWHELVLLGDEASATKSVSLTMVNAAGDPVTRWHLSNAWPSEITYYFDEAGLGREIVTMSSSFIQRVSV
jgi:hypothetical protein